MLSSKFLSHLQNELTQIENDGLYKRERIITSSQDAEIVANGKKLLNFCANNYLGLSNHPEVIKASQSTMDTHGYGMSSVRFICGTNLFLTLTIFVLVLSIAGFFPYNYHPAIIYLGDTGALFIGFMIAVLSLQGLKNATAVAVVTPMIILGVPITDTFLAIIRRTLSGQKFYTPDKHHLHHRLLSLGLTQC